MARETVTAHRGAISVADTTGRGTTIVIWPPRHEL
nr:hypothetical protein [Amycolatopsis sp. NBC_01488]